MKNLALVAVWLIGLLTAFPMHISAAEVASLALSPASVTGGKSSRASLKLNAPAPAGGLTITLASSKTTVATVPATVVVPAGSTSATFSVTSKVVTASTTTLISATGPALTVSATLTVTPAALLSISMSPTIIVNDRSATGKVTLSGPAPSGGIIVSLASSSSLISKPASVTVAAGASSASFTATAGTVSSSTPVTLSASYAGVTRSVTVTVAPLQVSSVSISPNNTGGGATVALTVNLNGTALGSSVVVTLSGGDPDVINLPATMTIPVGAKSKKINVTTYAVTSAQSLTIRAGFGGSSRSATLTLNPINLTSLALSPASITGGLNGTGTVSLNAPAPAGGIQVQLKSSNTAIARVPTSVTVPAGALTAKFTVTTSPVTASSSAVISGTFGSVTKSKTVSVVPVTVSLHTLSASSTVGGQGSLTGTVTLTSVAPANGIRVTLTSNSAVVSVPSSFTIPAGATKGTYTLTTSAVSVSTIGTISATDGRTTKSAKITVNPLALSSISSSTSSAGGYTIEATVSLNGKAPSDGAVVTISNSNPSAATVATSLVIPAGMSSAKLPIQLPIVSATATTTISASFGGIAKSVTITVKPASVSSISLSPASVTGGTTVVATVWLIGFAPASGLTVAVTSSSSIATVPATITMAPGAQMTRVTIQTSTVTTQGTASISVSAGGTTKSATLTVKPAQLSGIAPNPIFVAAGSNTSARVTLTGPAPSGGLLVSLSSSASTIISVPTSVLVPAGASSVNFKVTGASSAVMFQTANITASLGGVSFTVLAGVSEVVPAMLTFSPSLVVQGQTVSGTVTLSGAAPTGGFDVALKCSDTSIGIPATVKVNAGSNTATFTVTTSSAGGGKAKCSAEHSQNVAFADLEVILPQAAGLALNPAVVEGGRIVTATVTLSVAVPAGGSPVTIAVSNSGGVTTPATVAVQPGQQTASFAINVEPTATPRTVTVSIAYGGTTVQASLTVNPPTFTNLTVSRSTVGGGSPVIGTVSLSSIAPAGGVVVNLASDNPVASVPASVTIAAHSSTATFTIATVPVAGSNVVAKITATALGATKSVSLTVTPPRLEALSLDRSVVTGGIHPVTGTATLTGTAPSGGFVIDLVTSDAAASPPATVTVPFGESVVTFNVETSDVPAITPVTIMASAESFTFTASLTVEPLLKSLTLSNPAVTGGTAVTGTVTLSAAASSATTANLASANPAASVPTTISIAAGATQATFTVTTTPVHAAESGAISATLNGYARSVALTVNAPLLTGFALDKASVTGGSANVTGTVNINGPAPAGGAVVTLGSTNSAAASVPVSVTIPAGGTSTTFTVTTSVVTAVTNLTISATYQGPTLNQALRVNPFTLTAFTVSPTSLIGGVQNATGTVTISDFAPAGGLQVTLSSSAPSKASVPALVTVPAGTKTATFAITTFVTTTGSVTITAAYNGGTRTALLTVNALGPNTVTLSPSAIIGGGGSVTGTVTLNSAAPAGGQVVTLSSNNPAAVVPATVTVSAGQTSATFTITTSPPAATATVQIQAASNGKSASANLQLHLVTVSNLSLSPSTITGGSANVTGTVTLAAAAPSGGAVVSLTSSVPSVASVPASITIAAGATSAPFTVTTAVVTNTAAVSITATAYGSSRSAALTVNPFTVSAISVNQTTLIGGVQNAIATVAISAPAPTGGLTVALASSDPLVSMPASVTIAKGATSATAPVTSQSATATTPVTLSATYNAGAKSVVVMVIAIGPSTLALNPTSVIGGGSPATGTVTLNAAAPAGGLMVALASDKPAVAVPASVTVAAGQTSTTFPITTTPPAATTDVVITATAHDRSATATLHVILVTVASVTMSPVDVTGGSANVAGTVTLGAPAPAGGVAVSLASDNGAVSVPASVTVAQGATSASFSAVTSEVANTVTVAISGSAYGSTSAATITVQPFAVSAVSVSPALLLGGVENGTLTVMISAPAPAGGLIVDLSSSDPAAGVPATVTVSSGATTAAVQVTSTAVGAMTTATLSAAYNGGTQSTTVDIQPPSATSVTVSPTVARATDVVTGTVVLTGPIPAGGMTVTLASSDTTAATVPADVVVAEGATSATFTVTPQTLAAEQSTVISATAGGATVTGTLTVQP
jgi:trimeric autotransporter adhesin